MVHRIEILRTNPAMSKMIPRMIMAVSLSGSGRGAFGNGAVQQLLDTDRSHTREDGPSTLGGAPVGVGRVVIRAALERVGVPFSRSDFGRALLQVAPT